MFELWVRRLLAACYDDLSGVGRGPAYTPAAKPPKDGAVIANIQGSVEVRHANGQWQKAQEGEVIHAGDSVRTGRESKVELSFGNGITERFASTTTVSLQLHQDHHNLQDTLGKIWTKVMHSHSPESSKTTLPTGVVG